MNWSLFWFMMLMAFGLAGVGFFLGRAYEHLNGYNANLLDKRWQR